MKNEITSSEEKWRHSELNTVIIIRMYLLLIYDKTRATGIHINDKYKYIHIHMYIYVR